MSAITVCLQSRYVCNHGMSAITVYLQSRYVCNHGFVRDYRTRFQLQFYVVLSTLNFENLRYNSGVIPRGNLTTPVMFSG